MSYQALMAEVHAGATIAIDGATGTELERRGVPMYPGAWCAVATEVNPSVLQQIHEDYIRAGARVVTANTFATTREVLDSVGLAHKFESLNRQAVEVAVAARDAAQGERPVLVAGSISPTRPSSGFSPRMTGPSQFEADCNEMAAIHKAAGCDLILAEMLGHPEYSPCVVRAAKANDLPVWIGISALRRKDGTLGTYTDERIPLADVIGPILAEGGDVVGIMHSKSEVTAEALAVLAQQWSGPTMAYPDSINEGADNLQLDRVIDETSFVDYCVQWHATGVRILGGCCGLTLSHIVALTERLGIPGP